MKKLLALLLIFVSLSSLKAEPPIGNSGTEKLTREPVSVPTQKQVQDVPSKPGWGKTIKAMYNQHPKKFIGSIFCFTNSAFALFLLYVINQNNQTGLVDLANQIAGLPKINPNLIIGFVSFSGSASIAGLSYIYKNTEVPIQEKPNVELSDDKK